MEIMENNLANGRNGGVKKRKLLRDWEKWGKYQNWPFAILFPQSEMESMTEFKVSLSSQIKWTSGWGWYNWKLIRPEWGLVSWGEMKMVLAISEFCLKFWTSMECRMFLSMSRGFSNFPFSQTFRIVSFSLQFPCDNFYSMQTNGMEVMMWMMMMMMLTFLYPFIHLFYFCWLFSVIYIQLLVTECWLNENEHHHFPPLLQTTPDCRQNNILSWFLWKWHLTFLHSNSIPFLCGCENFGLSINRNYIK